MDGTSATKTEGRGASPVTAADVAERAGVSRSTVSRAFTPGRSVGPAARARILAAARDLGYEPDGLAKALISGRSGIVGILMGELANPIHAVLHQALTLRLQQNGLIPLAAQLGAGVGIAELVAMFRRYRAEVVVLTAMDVTPDLVDACRKAGLKVLLLNRIDEAGRVSSVCADVRQGGRLAAEHLVSIGRRRIVVAEGVRGSWTAATRLDGHLAGLDTAGVAPVAVLSGGYRYEDGVTAARAVAEARCEGVLCPNDLFALGLLDTLRNRFGLRVPDDIAIVGFDDIPMADWGAYGLTTVRLPVNRMADRGFREVQVLSEKADDGAATVWVPCRMVVRASA